ncbi:hypothetical protein [Sinorhizobium fredii]|uniref:hypothetical protein n=1 Tax=Rhizobium fredii TaxID=380 RepID=UPI0004B3731D|nr:hypothetical protein [Sinorhizobium fredii]AWM24078.1 hypothetical protein AOX55_0000801 [Sinorhizobium fredii CCBAU 25509]
MNTTSINGTQVFVLDNRDWSKATLIALALNSDNFSIEHEQDADYGRLEIFTLDDGMWARVREIDENQIENEELGDRFGLTFVKTVDERWNGYDPDDDIQYVVRFWKVEAFEEEEDLAGKMFPELN